MSDAPTDLPHPKKTLHSKRSFGKYPKPLDSPAYDASEEDNDPLTDDNASVISVPFRPSTNATRSVATSTSHTSKSSRKHQLASSVLSDSDGIDSPTYDGDIESSTTAGPDGHPSSKATLTPSHHHRNSSGSTLTSPTSAVFPSVNNNSSTQPLNQNTPRLGNSDAPPIFLTQPSNSSLPKSPPETTKVPSPDGVDSAALTQEDIRAFVQKAVDGESFRKYKINPPPTDRPVRVYADGVYDLFHFGHALQLRQAKLSFANVYLLVGVCDDVLVEEHKAHCIMHHHERCESARHCKWVDEVVPDAPWVIDANFVDKWKIDYVAHDEDPYGALGHDDVYAFAKKQGKFIPTRRTPGVSTSELLERIVSGYRKRDFDKKLEKMGHAELKAEGSDYDDSRPTSRSMSPMLAAGSIPPAHPSVLKPTTGPF